MKELSDDRLANFDTDYIENLVGWGKMEKVITTLFPDGRFSFLDVGGGNGTFADKLLARFPKAYGTVLDNAKFLLDKNSYHNRKKLIESSVERMTHHLDGSEFDLIVFNWALHHFVDDSYKKTIKSISNALRSSNQLLAENGLISVLENAYLPYFFEIWPSRIIYYSLSSKLLSFATKRLGVNTYGTGICYLSEKLWCSMIEDAGLKILNCEIMNSYELDAFKKVTCLIKGIDVINIIAGKQSCQ